MIKKLSVFLCAMVLVFGVVGNANSALVDRGRGLMYDDVLDITWLQDTNLAESNKFGFESHPLYDSAILSNGKMGWNFATDLYIDAMNDANYLGYNDWRLPYADNPDSEVGHMYYTNLGGTFGGPMPSPIFTDGNGILSTFLIDPSDEPQFWLIPEYDDVYAYIYMFGLPNTNNGGTYHTVKTAWMHVWPVRDGDVSISDIPSVPPPPIPIPSAIWLLGSGFIGLVGVRRKFRKA
jgi:hypothetical protein